MKYNQYYIRNRDPKDSRNDWAIAVIIDAEQWAPRSRKHRGCNLDNLVGSRAMTDEEIEEYKNNYRVCFWRYYDWQTFINDELKYLPADHPFMEKVYEWKKRYTNIPEKPGQQLAMNIGEENEW